MGPIFDYESVKHITNQDFISCYRNILVDCELIEAKYRAGNLRDCCKAVRATNEIILRYMYERLIGSRRNLPTAGTIVHDLEFVGKVDNVKLILAAQDVQRLGNMYVHDTLPQNETEAQFQLRMKQEAEMLSENTKNILECFSKALKLEIDFINHNISGVRGELNINFQPAVKGGISHGKNILEADLTGVSDRRKYKYVWKIREGMEEAQIIQNNGRTLILQQWMVGKTIRLEAIHNVTNQVLSKEFGPVRNDEVPVEQKKPSVLTSSAVSQMKDTVRSETASKKVQLQPVRMSASDRNSDAVAIRNGYFRCCELADELKKKTALLRAERVRIFGDPNATYEQKMAALQAEDIAYTAELENIAEMKRYAEKLHSMTKV